MGSRQFFEPVHLAAFNTPNDRIIETNFNLMAQGFRALRDEAEDAADAAASGSGVEGNGTVGTIPKFKTTSSLEDSIMVEASGVVTLTGSEYVTALMSANDVAVRSIDGFRIPWVEGNQAFHPDTFVSGDWTVSHNIDYSATQADYDGVTIDPSYGLLKKLFSSFNAAGSRASFRFTFTHNLGGFTGHELRVGATQAADDNANVAASFPVFAYLRPQSFFGTSRMQFHSSSTTLTGSYVLTNEAVYVVEMSLAWVSTTSITATYSLYNSTGTTLHETFSGTLTTVPSGSDIYLGFYSNNNDLQLTDVLVSGSSISNTLNNSHLLVQGQMFYNPSTERVGIGPGSWPPSYTVDVRGTLGVSGTSTLGVVTVSSTLGVTGVATFTAAPVMSALTASLPVFTDGSKALVSNTMTGTGNVVMSASPTITGTIGAASLTLSGTLGVTGVATFTAQPIMSSLTASLPVFTDGSKGLVSNAMTGTGNVVMSVGPTLTGTIGAASMTLSGTLGVTGVSTLSGNVIFGAGIALGSAFAQYRIPYISSGAGDGGLGATSGLTYNNSTTTFGTINATMSGTLGVTGATTAAAATFSGAVTGNSTGSGTSSAFLASAASPSIAWAVTGAGANEKNWDVQGTATTLAFRTRGDLNETGDSWLIATRSGTTVSGVTFLPVVTLTAAPILSALTASLPVFTNGSKVLVSNAMTGTGNVVMSASPTLTGTIIAAAATFSGAVTGNSTGSGTSSAFLASAAGPTITWVVTGAASNEKNWDIQGGATTLTFRTRTDANGSGVDWLTATRTGTTVSGVTFSPVVTFTAAPIMSALTASLPVFTNGSKALVSNTMTGTGSVVMSASPTLTGTVSAAAITLTGLLLTVASATGSAGIRIPHGAAPAAPVDGDLWTTSAGGMFVRINGVTKTVTLT